MGAYAIDIIKILVVESCQCSLDEIYANPSILANLLFLILRTYVQAASSALGIEASS
jgi:hypothetical protein